MQGNKNGVLRKRSSDGFIMGALWVWSVSMIMDRWGRWFLWHRISEVVDQSEGVVSFWGCEQVYKRTAGHDQFW